jgi:aspartyl-tRNA(Asn)/glutamyl-tRNA(Gln) amidotransferase subunit A
LLPFALGNDAGGSVRIPAALCGATGFMPTYYRVSPQGPSLCLTIGQNGPIATCARDAALVAAVIADSGEAPLRLPLLPEIKASRPLQGLRVGLFKLWFQDCDEAVLTTCNAALTALETLGEALGAVFFCPCLSPYGDGFSRRAVAAERESYMSCTAPHHWPV